MRFYAFVFFSLLPIYSLAEAPLSRDAEAENLTRTMLAIELGRAEYCAAKLEDIKDSYLAFKYYLDILPSFDKSDDSFESFVSMADFSFADMQMGYNNGRIDDDELLSKCNDTVKSIKYMLIVMESIGYQMDVSPPRGMSLTELLKI